jgi:hypothetical protein
MKKTLQFSSAILFLILMVSSCSVDKRLYRNGYHVEWNSKTDKNVSENNSTTIVPVDPEINTHESTIESYPPDTLATASTDEKPVISEKKKTTFGPVEKSQEPITPTVKHPKAAEFKQGFKTGFHSLSMQGDVPYLPLAVAAFVLGILSIFAYYGAFVLGLLAIIFGVIALHHIHDSGGYRGSTMALIGLICGIVGIALITSIIIIK